jgi:hypothetical protein
MNLAEDMEARLYLSVPLNTKLNLDEFWKTINTGRLLSGEEGVLFIDSPSLKVLDSFAIELFKMVVEASNES